MYIEFCRSHYWASRYGESKLFCTVWPETQFQIMAPTIFNDYVWDLGSLTGIFDYDEDDDDGIVKEIINVTRVINATLGHKIVQENGHFLWEYFLVLSILVIIAVSVIANLVCGCSLCHLTRKNATLEYRIQYRTSKYLFPVFILDQRIV